MPTHEAMPGEWIDAAPIRTVVSAEIAAAQGTVWQEVADHASWPEWFTELDSVEVTGAAAGVGGTRRVVMRGLPFDEVFTAWEEPRLFAWAVTGSRLPILSRLVESVRLEPTESGCRLEYAQGIQARRGFGWLLGIFRRRNQSAIEHAVGRLKARAEAADRD